MEPPHKEASIQRLQGVPWRALEGLGTSLEAPLAAILGGAAAERVVERFLRGRRDLGRDARAAVAEALFGVGLWRRRIEAHLGLSPPPPLWSLASLLRDLAALSDGETLAGLAPGTLPPPRLGLDLSARYSLPPWLADTLRREVGCEAAELADALDLPGPVCLRPNLLRIGPQALMRRLRREGVDARPGRWAATALVVASPRPNIYGLASYRDGLFEVQDEGSQLAGALLEARPGDEVLDLCAGAGGKALLLAGAVGPWGRVHAADPDASKLDRLRQRARRAGITSVVLHGARPPPGLTVDRVLVDAPCSELGPLRRGPDLRFRLDPGSFEALPDLQIAILARAARHLRRGGRLAYVTCTFRREENEDVAHAFERSHPQLARIRPAAPAALVDRDGFFRAFPHRHGTDGFFGAVYERAR